MSQIADLLLLPTKQLEGPRRVALTIRPQRLAFLVDSSDSPSALAAIASACLTWGGKHQFLIPCTPGGVPDGPWLKILECHDPDVIIDLVGADPSFLEEQKRSLDRTTHRWENPTETMEIVGATVSSRLRRWRRLRPTNESYVTISFSPLADHALALPLAFRYGVLDCRPMNRDLIIRGAYEAARHQDFVRVEEADPSQLQTERLIELITAPVPTTLSLASVLELGATQVHYPTLPQLTWGGPPPRGPSYRLGGDDASWQAEYEQHNEAYYRRIVVVGAANSVIDLCLAWNLRAQRSHDFLLPIWVTPEWMNTTPVLQSMNWGLAHIQHGFLEPFVPRGIHLVSASMDTDQLAGLVPSESIPTCSHGPDRIDRFFTDRFGIGLEQESVLYFRRGIAHQGIPDYTQLGDFSELERVGWSASIDGYQLPRGSRDDYQRFDLSRIAREGFASFFNVGTHNPGDVLSLIGVDGDRLLRGAMAQGGFEARASTKTRTAVAILKLIGDGIGLRVLASSRVYELLNSLATIGRRQSVQQMVERAFKQRFPDPPAPDQVAELVESVELEARRAGQDNLLDQNGSLLKHELGDDVPQKVRETIINWLVQRRVLLRGYRITCPVCGLANRWYPVDRLASVHRCDGCQEEMPLPVRVDTLAWQYRLNEVVAHAIDQGVLAQLLTISRMMYEWTKGSLRDFLGFLPGVELLEGPDSDSPSMEIDVLAIKGGRIIIAECKRGDDLHEDDPERFAALAGRLNCSRIIYATPRTFDRTSAVVERALSLDSPARVEVWEKPDLLDPGHEPGDPAGYLVRIARAIEDRRASGLG